MRRIEFKDHDHCQLVNNLRAIAEQFHDHGSLRNRIAGVVKQFFDDHDAAPVAGVGGDLPPLHKTVIAHCNDLSDCAAMLDEDGRFKATAAEIRVAVTELRAAVALNRAQQGEPVGYLIEWRGGTRHRLAFQKPGPVELKEMGSSPEDVRIMEVYRCAAIKEAAPADAATGFAAKMVASQGPLAPDAARVLHDAAWELYGTDELAPVEDAREQPEPPYKARYRVKLRRGDGWIVKPEAEVTDGFMGTFSRAWVIEKGIYEGEWAMQPRDSAWPEDANSWVALGDLELIDEPEQPQGERRDEFEQAMKAKGHRTDRHDTGEYVGVTSYRWEGWSELAKKIGGG